YAYDRIVVPAGTKVLGHIAALEDASKVARTQTLLQGDFTSHRHVVMQFDTIVMDDGQQIGIQTLVKNEIPHIKRTEAPNRENEDAQADDTGGLGHKAEREAKNQVKAAISSAKQNTRDVLAEITQPGRTARLKEALVERMPYHRQFID